MLDWLPNTDFAHAVYVFLISMVPIIELRGAVPIGIGLGLPANVVLPVAIVGNILPVPFIIIFIRRIFHWIKTKTKFGQKIERLETKAMSKADRIIKYEWLGLFIFVAIPLPGTGAWTGALIAALLDIRLKKALPAIACGVVVAGIIMTLLGVGVKSVATGG